MSEMLFETPLTSWHKAKGAKMAPFAGWNMPIQYEGILAEHEHTRTNAAIFDISHMGEFIVQGPSSMAALGRAVSHNLINLAVGKCRYGFLLNEKGCVLDDMIIYNLGFERFMIVVNAACIEKDKAAIKSRLPDNVELIDISNDIAKIDLQGPKSLMVLQDVLKEDFSHLGYFSFHKTKFADESLIVSRTGYTGELGYELYVQAGHALQLWELLANDQRVKPVGLGARDTLRLEAGYLLYGHDLDDTHTPLEAGLGQMLTSTTAYIGRERAMDSCQTLVPLRIEGRRTARHGDIVVSTDNKVLGTVTSASFAPSLGYCIALAWVTAEDAEADNFIVRTAKTQLEAKKATLPFYTAGTARIKVKQ